MHLSPSSPTAFAGACRHPRPGRPVRWPRRSAGSRWAPRGQPQAQARRSSPCPHARRRHARRRRRCRMRRRCGRHPRPRPRGTPAGPHGPRPALGTRCLRMRTCRSGCRRRAHTAGRCSRTRGTPRRPTEPTTARLRPAAPRTCRTGRHQCRARPAARATPAMTRAAGSRAGRQRATQARQAPIHQARAACRRGPRRPCGRQGCCPGGRHGRRRGMLQPTPCPTEGTMCRAGVRCRRRWPAARCHRRPHPTGLDLASWLYVLALSDARGCGPGSTC